VKRPRRAARSRVTRIRINGPPPPSTLPSRGPLQHLFRFAAPALLTARLGSPWSPAQCRPASKKICSSNFYLKRTSKVTFRSARRSTTPSLHPNRSSDLAVGCLGFHLSRRAPRRIRLAQGAWIFFLPNDLALCASNFRLEGFLEAPVDVVTLAVTI
jgi:hypothetical protein